jgi:4-hydroxybenzoate polyprenyltransferase
MVALIRTLRPLNLGIILLTMLLLEYGLIAPLLKTLPFHEAGSSPFVTSRSHFGLLILSTLMIAGAGNIINDYFDLRADRVNKPDRVVIGRQVKRRVAMLTHFVLNVLGLLIGAWVSWRSGVWFVILFQVFAGGVLWFYSLYLKHEPLIGNLSIALITALIPLMLLLFEFIPLYQALGEGLFIPLRDAELSGKDPSSRLNLIIFWTLAYSCFAFVSTLIRELQKDLADMEGDRTVGARTLPLLLGAKRTKGIALGLIILFLAALGFGWASFLKDLPTLLYMLIGIGTPCFVSAVLLFYGSDEGSGYAKASIAMKLTMLMGILFPIFALAMGPEKIYIP